MMRWLVVLISGVVLAACSAAVERSHASGSIITLFGQIGVVDRANVDPVVEPLFGTLGVEFDTALGLNYESLAALQQHSIRTDFPLGGEHHVFRGPRLHDVLAVALPEGDMVRVTALDGYQRDISMERIEQDGVILAISRNGIPLGLGGLGPTMLVWPRGEDPALAEMSDDDWVWGILTLEVRSPA
ncbi:MAG: hypothetical protein GYB36_04955 [Alphaproteobacteria bacterium]|nr:hypothetical protein [Alphaproteobacteria bacterium]